MRDGQLEETFLEMLEKWNKILPEFEKMKKEERKKKKLPKKQTTRQMIIHKMPD